MLRNVNSDGSLLDISILSVWYPSMTAGVTQAAFNICVDIKSLDKASLHLVANAPSGVGR